MASTYLTPNMSLVIPVVQTQIGPDWASNINASLTILDAHTHSPGSGSQITPTGININSDLAFNANNGISFRSVRFSPNGSALAGTSDLGCLYEAGVDLYYNDGSGNQIRITQSGSVAGSSGTITGLPSGTASAAYQSTQGTFQFQQATSTAANIDAASLIVRYPGSYPTPSGNGIILQAPSGISSLYSLTLPSLPGQTNVMTLGTSGSIASITYDQVAQGMTSVGADAIATSMSATGAQTIATTMSSTGANTIAANRTRSFGSNNQGIGGIASTSSSGSFSTTSGSYVSVTNQSITLTTSGRPIVIGLTSDFGSTDAYLQTRGGTVMTLQITRGATAIYRAIVGLPATAIIMQVPPSSVTCIDLIGAGTYVYTLSVKSSTGAIVDVVGTSMYAYEL